MVKVAMLGRVMLAAAMVAAAIAVHMAAAQDLQDDVPLTDKDLESEESIRSLYARWRSVFAASSRNDDLTLTAEEEGGRLEAFKKNARYIHEFNKKKDAAYQLALNKFSDLTDEQFAATFTCARNPEAIDGFKKSLARGVDSRRRQQAAPVASTASAVDWRARGAVTAVKSQGQCGSCWAFAAVGAVESANAVATGNLLTLSEQQVLDCSGAGDCSGGFLHKALEYAVTTGITLDAFQWWRPPYYPAYTARQESCRFDPNRPPVVKIDSTFVGPQRNEAVLRQLVSIRPVAVLIEASSPAFVSYRRGVFTGPCGTALNHGVLIVGYNTTADGTRYWIVKNSWGANWGDNGYIYMQRDVAATEGLCGIAMLPHTANIQHARPTADAAVAAT